ncbi:hypothetical protein PPERSA_03046 [Pseudocohnilembus persalinus]|uniref:Uncharacterized protein n=1 Tax=Pseudocohnilembus persalinus TaxID=266149 RepID=A0A0V0QF01_PSEPJ|nr:hypothetical protein PPERSA_03046 [Pseudocohnilembus persalinus]|eukprot:KRX00786.1 hypothetical protein PPERSA_03046 [Pseudocohnilembus persalinus]
MALKFLNNTKVKSFYENQNIQETQNLQNQNKQQQYNDQEIAQKEAQQNLNLQNIEGGQFNEKVEEERKAQQLQSQNEYTQNIKNQYDFQRNLENISSDCFSYQSDNINSCQQPSLKFLYNNRILAKDEETSQLKDEEKAIYSATIQKLNLGNSGISQNSNKSILNQNNNINYDYEEKTPMENSFIQKFNQQQFQIEEEGLNDYEQNRNMSILDSIYSLKQDLNKQQQQFTNQKLQLIKNYNQNMQTNKPNDDQLDCRKFELVEKQQECQTPYLLNTSQQTIKQDKNCSYRHLGGLETAKQNTCNNEQGSNQLIQEITLRQQELSQQNSEQQHWENQKKDYVFQKIQDYILNNSKCKIPWSDSNLQRVKQHALKYLENYKK